ncbi:MAG: hypothetical protein HN976_11045 [Lentisphaerae bacterium]|jgi:hypothetical protein|nr:hypothetical protein [Lentisphaerota bacterium]MBT7055618.1 hypothetical protein [Lentisphaerota bacterium]
MTRIWCGILAILLGPTAVSAPTSTAPLFEWGAGAVPSSTGRDVWQKRGAGVSLTDSPPRAILECHAGFRAVNPIPPQETFSVEVIFRCRRTMGNLQIVTTGLMIPGKDAPAITGDRRQWCLEVRGEGDRIGPPGFFSIAVRGADGQWRKRFSNARIREEWHHVVGAFDGQSVLLFLDGEKQDREFQVGRSRSEDGLLKPTGLGGIVPVIGDGSGGDSMGGYRSAGNGLDGQVALLRIRKDVPTMADVRRWQSAAALALPELTATLPPRPPPAKAPFSVIYSNDFTNLGIVTPFHAKGAPFERDDLRQSVLETKGTGVHMLQPAHGQVPWWPSKIYPLTEHHAWWADRYGIPTEKQRIPAQHREIMAGWDPFADFLAACREAGQHAFISMRLNDTHHLQHADNPKCRTGYHSISRFYVENPEYRLKGVGSGLDWAQPEVRELIFAYIEEICTSYDLDGFELDFMRFPNFFRDSCPLDERVRIITGFVKRVSGVLGNRGFPGSRRGDTRKRWLCARVPGRLEQMAEVGICLPKLVDAGVDMVNLSASFFTGPYHDVGTVRNMLPDAAIYVEMCHTTLTGKVVNQRGGDNFTFLRTTDHQYYTAAHMAYEEGADGVSLFNFVYTREHGSNTEARGPWCEPPFHVLPRLGDPGWLARQPQWYVLANTWGVKPLPARSEATEPLVCRLEMAPNSHRMEDGVLRLLSKGTDAIGRWRVLFNGEILRGTSAVDRPLPHPHDANLNLNGSYVCFELPRSIVRRGANHLILIPREGTQADIDYLDVVLP